MKKPKVKNLEEFENLIQTKATKIFEDFRTIYDVIKNKQKFKNGVQSDLHKQTGVTQSNPKFLGVHDAIRDIDDNFKNKETYYEAIVIFCNNNNRDIDEVIEYLTDVRSEIIAEDMIESYRGANKMENPVTEPVLTPNDNKKDYTIARQAIAMKFILDELNASQIDQTNVARFLNVISRGELIENIKNTNTYKKVLEYSTFNKHSLNDLEFLRSIFDKIGLQSITAKIDNEIKRLQNIG